MTMERVDLRGVRATLLMTLYIRAYDARNAHPILGDRLASEVLGRIDYDFAAFRRFRFEVPTICCRAQYFDACTMEFLAAHPDGQVLHLGCGLDSRPLRVRCPATARWLDVDFPDVIELRRRLYDLPDQVEQIPSSVTDHTWWDRVDRGRPTFVIGEGLFMYLERDDVHQLVDRAIALDAAGGLAFDAVAPWTIRVSNRSKEFRDVDARFRWAYRGSEFASRHPPLRELDDRAVTSLLVDATADRPLLLRGVYRALDLFPPMSNAMRLHRFAFGG